MVRDNLKDYDYYNNYIISEQERINKFSNVLKTLNNTAPQYAQCKQYLSNYYRNIINAAYSKGCSKSEVKSYIEKYFTVFDFDRKTEYADIIDALSFIIIFDIKVPKITQLSHQDSLVNTLCDYISSKEIKTATDIHLVYDDAYHIYMDALYNKISCVDYISFLNNNWYETNKDMYWYDNHKNDNNTYTGYWCWIGAAVAKILSYPLNTVCNCKYIPKDML